MTTSFSEAINYCRHVFNEKILKLLEETGVVTTPGSGFGPSGEGYFRLTAFGTYENTLAAMERIQTL